MNKEEFKNKKNLVLTEKMDIGTAEFNKFQAVILNKARERSANQRQAIELLAIKFKMEDYISSQCYG